MGWGAWPPEEGRSPLKPSSSCPASALPNACLLFFIENRGICCFCLFGAAPRTSQQIPGPPRSSQEFPGAAKSTQELPGAAKSSPEFPGAPRSSQEFPGAPRSSWELTGVPRSCQELPGFQKLVGVSVWLAEGGSAWSQIMFLLFLLFQ